MKRILAVALAAGLTVAGASAVNAQVPQDPPNITGTCTSVIAGGVTPRPCFEGERPFVNAVELSGDNRAETAVVVVERYLSGEFGPGLVFLARYEDESASVTAAVLTGGTWVRLPGGNGPLDADTLAELRAVSVGATGVVIVGGDGAIGIDQRVEAVRVLEGWTS